jgi:steroid delta-isomerase-like uncharacterized protein
MSAEDNVATAQRIVDEAWNARNLDALDELVASDVVNHDPADPEDVRGLDALKERIAGYHAAMSDLKVTFDEAFGSGDFVATRWHAEGTNDGELAGMPATGKRVSMTGLSIDRFDADGKLAETWDQWDNLGFMQQLGMIPEGATATG